MPPGGAVYHLAMPPSVFLQFTANCPNFPLHRLLAEGW